jgi:HEAT repeat protein
MGKSIIQLDNEDTPPLTIKEQIIALGDYKSREAATRALIQIGQPAVEPLIATLGESYWSVRGAAAEALGAIGDARAVKPLIAALGDSDPFVRRAAAEALGAIGDARAVEPLIAALKDREEGVERMAIRALGWIGDTRAIKPLIDVIRNDIWYLGREAEGVLEYCFFSSDELRHRFKREYEIFEVLRDDLYGC